MKKLFLFILTSLFILRTAMNCAAKDEQIYEDLGLVLMIPSLDINTEIVTAPWDGKNWDVFGLEHRVGLLEGSALPGEGYAVIAGHNHLSSDEIGPFLYIRDMEVNDVIFVANDNEMKRFKVFANVLLSADDGAGLAKTALSEDTTLVLLTCENESEDGTYINRRVIFAKPVED